MMTRILIPTSKIQFFKRICNYAEDLLPEDERLRGTALYRKYCIPLGYKDFNNLRNMAKGCNDKAVKFGDILYGMITADYSPGLDKGSEVSIISAAAAKAIELESEVDGLYLMSQFHKAISEKEEFDLNNPLYRFSIPIKDDHYNLAMESIISRMKNLFDKGIKDESQRKRLFDLNAKDLSYNFSYIKSNLDRSSLMIVRLSSSFK